MIVKTLEVINKAVLTPSEQAAVDNNEALFFYHTWLRSEIRLIEIAHDILLTHCHDGKNSNYLNTEVCQEVKTIFERSSEDNPHDDDIGILDDVMYDLSDMITEIHNIEGYHCGYHEGDWGLWPNLEN